MNSIIQDILYKQLVVKYSYKNGVTKAAIKLKYDGTEKACRISQDVHIRIQGNIQRKK